MRRFSILCVLCLSLAAALAGSATANAAVLIGDQNIESTLDSNSAGSAEAFPFSQATGGTASSISVYVDSQNTARTLTAGLYSNSSGHPGALLASGSLAPKAGTWNTVSIASTAISAGGTYWLAVLGNSGTVYFRDRNGGPCYSVSSYQTNLSSLPSSWTSSVQWNTCPISAYVNGTGTATAAPVNMAVPAISGSAMQGQSLSTSNGTWSNSPTSYAYQWQDCNSSGASCTNVSGATSSSYTLTSSDVNHTMRALVAASNTGGSALATSAQTPMVSSPPPAAPVNTALPAVSGTATQGQTLSTSNGTWSGSPTGYAYQWQDCNSSGASCTNVSGATLSSYTLTSGDVGHTMRAVVTATNTGGSTPATSAPTATVAAPPAPPSNTALPAISGSTVQGQALNVSNGSWSGSPTGYSYQWRDCDTSGSNCTDISGATSTSYTLAAGDVGHTIRAVATASNSSGSASATSVPTGVVTTGGTSYAPTYVQSNATLNATGSGLTSGTSAFTSTVTKGDLLVIAVGYRGAPQTLALNDNLGTSFQEAGTPTNTTQSTGPYTGAIYWGIAPSSGADTVTVSFPSSTGYVEVYDHEYNAKNPRLDVTSNATGTGTTVTSGAATTHYSNELMLGYAIVNVTIGAPGSGYTQRQSVGGDMTEDMAVNSNGSYAATASNPDGGVWQGQMATFYGTGPNSIPTVTQVSPNSGSTSGGTSVTIAGTNFTGATAVTFGSTNATNFAVNSPTQITATSPAEAAGTVDVMVTTPGGTSTTNVNDGFTFSSGGAGAPVNSVGPYFTASTLSGSTPGTCNNGCAVVAHTLAVSTGTWSPTPTSYGYQWYRCTTTSAQPPITGSCTGISGATGSSYTVQSADSGHSLVPIVTAFNGGTASTPTGLSSGTCDTGEMVGSVGLQDSGYHAAPTSQPAGCSPISAVVGTSQTAEEFCTNAVTTCGYADPLNKTAGVPAGVTPSTTGACATYANGGSISSGTVTINGCKITGGLSISGGNVTITNSDLGGWADPGGSNPPINISGGTVNVNHTTLHGLGPNQQGIQMFEYVHGSGVLTVDHNFTYNGSRIGHNTSTAAVGLTVTNSFCWLSAAATNDHYECTYTGPPSNTTIQNSVFLNWHTQTGATYTDDNTGSCCSTALDFENNLLGGGGYTLYGGYRTPNLINANADTIIGNRFSRVAWPGGGNTGVTAFVSPSSTQSGNIWDDTGASTGALH